MALSCGFFNSVSGDRVYNADQLSSMFEGLITDGVYESVGDAMAVTASSGMIVQVGTGRALLRAKWVRNDAPVDVELNSAHALLNRYTAIVLRLDINSRDITIEQIDGTAASNPTKPAIIRNSQYFDLLLAYVYVGASVTAITQSVIEDQRANTTYCGWVTGIITQVDTSQLFLQWQTAYEEFYAQMRSWMTAEQSAFETWFDALTQQLQVNTYIEEYKKTATVNSAASQDITLNMTGYTYDADDIFIVSFNGLAAEPTTDYTLNTSGATPILHVNMTGSASNPQTVEIRILKSKIGASNL